MEIDARTHLEVWEHFAVDDDIVGVLLGLWVVIIVDPQLWPLLKPNHATPRHNPPHHTESSRACVPTQQTVSAQRTTQ